MAYIIILKNNYLWVNDTEKDLQYEALAKDVLIRKQEPDSESYAFTGVNGMPTTIIPLTDLKDENGDDWADAATFEDWYTTNLGKSSGGATPGNSTSTIAYKTAVTSDGSSPFIVSVPADTYIDDIVNLTQNTTLSGWTQGAAGENVTISESTSDGDELLIMGQTYVDVAPPSQSKIFVMYVSGQDNTGFLGADIRRNTFGFDFTFTRLATGFFSVPEFDPSTHFLDDSISYTITSMGWSVEDNGLVTLENGIPSDSAFQFGGFIRITEY